MHSTVTCSILSQVKKSRSQKSTFRRSRGDLIAVFLYLKGPTRNLERNFYKGPVARGQGAIALD